MQLTYQKCFLCFQVQRLPCLHSSNLMHDTLTGKLDTIGFEDVLNSKLFHTVIHSITILDTKCNEIKCWWPWEIRWRSIWSWKNSDYHMISQEATNIHVLYFVIPGIDTVSQWCLCVLLTTLSGCLWVHELLLQIQQMLKLWVNHTWWLKEN